MSSAIEIPEYVEISILVIQRMSGALPFDVYIKRGENKYTKIFPKGELVDVERSKYYHDSKGVEALYVHKEDYRQYLLFVEHVANHIFPKSNSVPVEQLMGLAKEMADLTMLELIVDMHVDSTSVQHAISTVKACIEILAKDKVSLVKIIKLLNTHPYLMKHSIATSIFAIMLAQAEKLESEKNLIAVGLGSILHDVGMTQLAFDAEDKSELTPEEWKEVRKHPELGKRLLDSAKAATEEVRMIVLQHHEQMNGQGYPNNMTGKNIYYPAKIVSIADSFSSLVSKRSFREAFSPTKALEIMNSDRGKFDPAILKNFSGIFIKVK